MGNPLTYIALEQGMLHGRVYAFAEGADGAYWFGTMGGLSRWKDEQWTHWTTEQGEVLVTVEPVEEQRDVPSIP